MKIAILGYGKMGQAIEKIALERGHDIVMKTDSQNPTEQADFSTAEVAIDFSTPNTAFSNISTALGNGVPVISGTTAWLNQLSEAENLTTKNNTAFLYASNFSVGVNLFFELNKKLTELMKSQDQYTPSIKEIHHIHKVDAPSGTAITLAKNLSTKTAIESERTGEVPGTHIINYQSEIDSIEIKHEAHNRQGFALGAILAAEWIQTKKGVFSMSDMLNL
jgi:4-hydroxy-tetrahydrodipicolinate reductase